jgi:hypothetical protein
MGKEYTEYLVEYDNDNLVVYVSGLDSDDYWEEIACHDEVDDPESFAEGIREGFKQAGFFVTVIPVEYED